MTTSVSPIYLMIHILIDSGLSDGVEITFWAIGLENFGMEGSIFCSVLTLEVAQAQIEDGGECTVSSTQNDLAF